MKISVCICTWNRSRLLKNTLEYFQRTVVPEDIEWELIVIDNNSDDDTATVITEFSDSLPVRSYVEATPGHCAARNRAVTEFDGDFVLWTDDDVEVDKYWLSSYANVFANDEIHSFWGGPIEAKFETQAPEWITENWEILSGCFAVRDIGNGPVEFNDNLLPYGANFAVRADVQKQFRFDTSIGRKREQVVGGDEINLMTRLLAEGHHGEWVPGAKVLHVIPDERASEEYVYRYFVGQGKLQAGSGSLIAKIYRDLSKRWYAFRYRQTRNKTPSRQWLSHMINSALFDGRSQI